eukprot:TRINITY_DN7167_c0_g1_i2.p1 TRINITY_DN7167_c0_g1~~TRINITY_DN7167_c0_g1_i2.p1  ORF type:complete len:415 (+),score=48.88 TRINITY_DN7167_c0_g1_i2:388-1632(+)
MVENEASPEDRTEEGVRWLKCAAERGHQKSKNILAQMQLQAGVELKSLIAKARTNDVDAIFTLGRWFFDGWGVKQDRTEALKWFQKGSELGSERCRLRLADIYFSGVCSDIGIPKSYERSLSIYRELARSNMPLHCYKLGVCLKSGSISEQKESYKWFEKAAQQGSIEAMYELGLQSNGENNFKKARSWFNEAASKGHAASHRKLAEIYRSGQVGEKNEPEAFRWFLSGAELGDANCQYHVAKYYKEGNAGILKDDERAFGWCMLSADQGFAQAMFAAGEHYEQGIGVRADEREARKWFQKAADHGDMNALVRLAMHEAHDAAEYQHAEALRQAYQRFKTAADAGNALGCFWVGIYNWLGTVTDVPRNREEAIKWLQKAYEGGYPAKRHIDQILRGEKMTAEEQRSTYLQLIGK